MIRVFIRKNTRDWHASDHEAAIEGGYHYEDMRKFDCAALIDTEDLHSVFPLTQNITKSWIENRDVYGLPVAKNGCRSLSIGDVAFATKQAGSPGYILTNIGWRKLGCWDGYWESIERAKEGGE